MLQNVSVPSSAISVLPYQTDDIFRFGKTLLLDKTTHLNCSFFFRKKEHDKDSVGTNLILAICLFVVICGTFGNIGVFVVALQKRHIGLLSALKFGFKSIIDIFLIFFLVCDIATTAHLPGGWTQCADCWLQVYIYTAMGSAANWLIASLFFSRMLLLCSKKVYLCYANKCCPQFLVISILLVNFGMQFLFHMMDGVTKHERCGYVFPKSSENIFFIVMWLHILFTYLLPLLVIIMSILVIAKSYNHTRDDHDKIYPTHSEMEMGSNCPSSFHTMTSEDYNSLESLTRAMGRESISDNTLKSAVDEREKERLFRFPLNKRKGTPQLEHQVPLNMLPTPERQASHPNMEPHHDNMYKIGNLNRLFEVHMPDMTDTVSNMSSNTSSGSAVDSGGSEVSMFFEIRDRLDSLVSSGQSQSNIASPMDHTSPTSRESLVVRYLPPYSLDMDGLETGIESDINLEENMEYDQNVGENTEYDQNSRPISPIRLQSFPMNQGVQSYKKVPSPIVSFSFVNQSPTMSSVENLSDEADKLQSPIPILRQATNTKTIGQKEETPPFSKVQASPWDKRLSTNVESMKETIIDKSRRASIEGALTLFRAVPVIMSILDPITDPIWSLETEIVPSYRIAKRTKRKGSSVDEDKFNSPKTYGSPILSMRSGDQTRGQQIRSSGSHAFEFPTKLRKMRAQTVLDSDIRRLGMDIDDIFLTKSVIISASNSIQDALDSRRSYTVSSSSSDSHFSIASKDSNVVSNQSQPEVFKYVSKSKMARKSMNKLWFERSIASGMFIVPEHRGKLKVGSPGSVSDSADSSDMALQDKMRDELMESSKNKPSRFKRVVNDIICSNISQDNGINIWNPRDSFDPYSRQQSMEDIGIDISKPKVEKILTFRHLLKKVMAGKFVSNPSESKTFVDVQTETVEEVAGRKWRQNVLSKLQQYTPYSSEPSKDVTLTDTPVPENVITSQNSFLSKVQFFPKEPSSRGAPRLFQYSKSRFFKKEPLEPTNASLAAPAPPPAPPVQQGRFPFRRYNAWKAGDAPPHRPPGRLFFRRNIPKKQSLETIVPNNKINDFVGSTTVPLSGPFDEINNHPDEMSRRQNTKSIKFVLPLPSSDSTLRLSKTRQSLQNKMAEGDGKNETDKTFEEIVKPTRKQIAIHKMENEVRVKLPRRIYVDPKRQTYKIGEGHKFKARKQDSHIWWLLAAALLFFITQMPWVVFVVQNNIFGGDVSKDSTKWLQMELIMKVIKFSLNAFGAFIYIVFGTKLREGYQAICKAIRRFC